MQLDTASVHALVREFGLPRAELLHMGWSDEMLSQSAPQFSASFFVDWRLGRMLLDDRYDVDGGRWPDGHRSAQALGQQLIQQRFHAA